MIEIVIISTAVAIFNFIKYGNCRFKKNQLNNTVRFVLKLFNATTVASGV